MTLKHLKTLLSWPVGNPYIKGSGEFCLIPREKRQGLLRGMKRMMKSASVRMERKAEVQLLTPQRDKEEPTVY